MRLSLPNILPGATTVKLVITGTAVNFAGKAFLNNLVPLFREHLSQFAAHIKNDQQFMTNTAKQKIFALAGTGLLLTGTTLIFRTMRIPSTPEAKLKIALENAHAHKSSIKTSPLKTSPLKMSQLLTVIKEETVTDLLKEQQADSSSSQGTDSTDSLSSLSSAEP